MTDSSVASVQLSTFLLRIPGQARLTRSITELQNHSVYISVECDHAVALIDDAEYTNNCGMWTSNL